MKTMTTPPHVDVKCVRQEQGGEGTKKPKNNRRGGAAGEDEDEEEEKRKRGGGKEQKRAPGGPALVDCRRRTLGDDDEEMPGSPSFRVYFVDSPRDYSDDESVASAVSNAAGRKIKGKTGGPGRVDSIRSTTSEESSVGKLSKRQRNRRFKGLPKGPSAVYGLLNVRSCYTVQGNGSPQENPIPPSHSSGRINRTSSNVNNT